MEKSDIFVSSSIKSFMANILLLLILFFNVNSLEETKNLYLHKDNDLLLFLTKAGYLNSYQKSFSMKQAILVRLSPYEYIHSHKKP